MRKELVIKIIIAGALLFAASHVNAQLQGLDVVCPHDGTSSTIYTYTVPSGYSGPFTWEIQPEGSGEIHSVGARTASIKWYSSGQVTVWYRNPDDGGDPLPMFKDVHLFFGGILSGPTEEICPFSTFTLSLAGNYGSVERWESSLDGNTWTTVPGAGTRVNFALYEQNTYFRVVIGTLGQCGYRYSNSFFVRFKPVVTPPPFVPALRCTPGYAAGSASSAGNYSEYRWYNAAAGGTLLGVGRYYVTYLTGSQNIWLSGVSQGCESQRVLVPFDLLPQPSAPPAPAVTPACGSATVRLSSTSPGLEYFWESSPTGVETSNPAINNPYVATNSTTVYLRSRRLGASEAGSGETPGSSCWSGAYSTNVNVNLPPSSAYITGPTSVCSGIRTRYTLVNYTGTIVSWEMSRDDGTTWSTAGDPSGWLDVTTIRNLSIRAILQSNECGTGMSQPIQISVVQSTTPQVTHGSRCDAGPVTLIANSPGATSYKWFDQWGGQVATTATGVYETPWLIGTREFSVKAVFPSGCESAAAPAKAIVAVSPSPGMQYHCGYTNLSLTPSPDPSIQYYAQSSPDGEQRVQGFPFTVTTSGTVYVRAYNVTTGCWARPVPAQVDVYPVPSTAPTPTVEQRDCHGAFLNPVVANLPTDVRLYWQLGENDQSTDNLAATYWSMGGWQLNPWQVQHNGTYYVRSFHSVSGCWGPSTAVRVTMICLENQNQNFIVTSTILREGVTDDAQIDFLQTEDNARSVSYQDGLGRTMQDVIPQGSPDKEDIVQYVEYDELGRQEKNYLPYVHANSGRYQADAMARILEFYQSTGRGADRAITNYPFAETVFESSPLNRVKEQGAPGEDWQIWRTHTIKTNTRYNSGGEVRFWQVSDQGVFYSSKHYLERQLMVEEVINEDQNRSLKFVDRQGRTVLVSREVATGDWAKTYYGYDGFGRLALVIQPEGVKKLEGAPGNYWTLDETFIKQWCFTYKYDKFGRLVEKRVPGSLPEYFVYNLRHQVILTQNGNQRSAGRWNFIKYDTLQRVVVTGECTLPTSLGQVDVQKLADNNSTQSETKSAAPSATGYTLTRTFPSLEAYPAEVLTVSYYDNYTFNVTPHRPAEYVASGMTSEPIQSNQLVDKPTATSVRVLGYQQMLWTINFYDKWGRLIQSQSDHQMLGQLSGKDVITSRYDFSGNVLETHRRHLRTGHDEIIERNFYSYDHAGRELSHQHKINSGPVITLSTNQYNELSQLNRKRLHSTDGVIFKQNVDYRYNIRGWLEKVNDLEYSENSDLYGFELRYNQGSYQRSQGFYNGNISQLSYVTKADSEAKAYAFNYDMLDRLTEARYARRGPFGWEVFEGFDEKGFVYDHNGNISKLVRFGTIEGEFGNHRIDDLSYVYDGNRLKSVEDATNVNAGFKDGVHESMEYDYDANGNMTLDKNKGIDRITYNNRNLITSVVRDSSVISYVHDATGRKLSKLLSTPNPEESTARHYINGYEYYQGRLEFISLPQGRVIMGVEPEYQYHLNDHLGNVRLTFTSKEETEEVTATFEEPNQASEQKQFLRYDESRRVLSALFDRTNGSLPGYSQRLNGLDEKTGVARSISVMPGDVIKLSVHAKYVDGEQSNWTEALTSIMGAIATGGVPGTVVDGASYGTATTSFSYAGLLDKSEENNNGVGPKAYLNYVLLNSNFGFVTGGYKRMSDVAKENGQDVAHEQLRAEVRPTEPGYMYVWLSNEETRPVDVFFDDLSIEHFQLPIVSVSEYYPFGETFNGHERQPGVPQKYLYNGKEMQDDLEFHVYDYGARVYDPLIVQWNSKDPAGEKGRRHSLYSYAFNNPARFIDPDGMWPRSFTGNMSLDHTAKVLNDGGGELLHTGLGVAENIPGPVGVGAGVGHAILYTVEGEAFNAVVSGVGAAVNFIPGGKAAATAGTASIKTGVEAVSTVSKKVDDVTEVAALAIKEAQGRLDEAIAAGKEVVIIGDNHARVLAAADKIPNSLTLTNMPDYATKGVKDLQTAFGVHSEKWLSRTLSMNLGNRIVLNLGRDPGRVARGVAQGESHKAEEAVLRWLAREFPKEAPKVINLPLEKL